MPEMNQLVQSFKEETEKMKSVKLEDLHAVYNKWMNITDKSVIDVSYAVALSRELIETGNFKPLWIILVASSGGGKTEIIRPLMDWEHAYLLTDISTKALVTGHKTRDLDIIQDWDNKLVVVPDWSELLSKHPDDKKKIYSQLRNIYDGTAKYDSGLNRGKEPYKNLKITMLGCSTRAIDAQYLLGNLLGTRELLFRYKNANVRNALESAWNNTDSKEQMRQEIKDIGLRFLASHHPRVIEIPEYVKMKIFGYATYLSFMRASAEIDSYSGELISDVEKEDPTRVVEQLKALYISLKSLDENYGDEKALSIIQQLIVSSAHQKRIQISEFMLSKPEADYSTRDVVRQVKIGFKTAIAQLSVLWNLGILKREDIEKGDYGKVEYRWGLNKNHELVKMILNKQSVIAEYCTLLSPTKGYENTDESKTGVQATTGIDESGVQVK